MKIAYLGPKGTFTEKIALELFPNDNLISIQPIRNVIQAVESQEANYGIVPIENFYNGEVRETLDALTECKETRITKEKDIKIVHCLGVLPQHSEIKKILSKDQALEQCSQYLCKKYPKATTIATSSTAEAAREIVSKQMIDSAAIAPEQALVSSGLKVLEKDLCPNNKTRFVVLSRESTESTGDDKSLISIHPPIRDKPGVLYNSLKFFSEFQINLESIQSRPDGKKGYIFYVELLGHTRDEKVRNAIDSIKKYMDPSGKHKDTIKILGSYPN